MVKAWTRQSKIQSLPYYDGFPKVKGRDGPSWSRNILNYIFTCWLALWDDRNKDRHGRDETTRNTNRREQALRELDILYSLRNSVLHCDRSIFYDNLVDHKLKPTHVIRQWINTYQPIIIKSSKDAQKSSLLHVRTLFHYFGAS
jgi:hypothetical protein